VKRRINTTLQVLAVGGEGGKKGEIKLLSGGGGVPIDPIQIGRRKLPNSQREGGHIMVEARKPMA